MMKCKLLLLLVLASVPGCERATRTDNQAAEVKLSRPMLGTEATITAFADERQIAIDAIDAAFARIEDVNRLMSAYRDDSDVGQLNRADAHQPVPVAPETFHCLRAATSIATRTDGAFDITCRPLVELWKKAGRNNQLPTDDIIEETRQRIGWQKIALDPDARTVTLTAADMQIDLGGIAKGYALDLAAEALRQTGASTGLVDIGGDVRVLGPRRDGRPWRVGVRHPLGQRADVYKILELSHGAVATSGNQERYSEIEGRRFSHIIDPRIGWPAEQAPSVTVIAADGLTADAWATALSVLSVAAGKTLLAAPDAPDIEALWIDVRAEHVHTTETPGFAAYLAPE